MNSLDCNIFRNFTIRSALLVSLLCTVIILYAKATPEKALTTFANLTSSERAKMHLGYDPCIQYKPSTLQNNTKINLYAHGWNGCGQQNLKRSLYATPAIIYDFPDARKNRTSSFRYASFGQCADIMPTIFILSAIIESGIANTINLIGFSRGGATLVNTIAILNNPQCYTEQLTSMGVDPIRCKEILNAISRGVVVLDCPLKNTNDGVFRGIQRSRSHLLTYHENYCTYNNNPTSWLKTLYHTSVNTLITCIDLILYLTVNYLIFPIYTDYAPWKEQPIYSLQDWPSKSITTIIRYDQCDSMVSNENDIQFFQTIHNLNPLRTFLIITNKCGHCSHCQELTFFFTWLTTATQINTKFTNLFAMNLFL